MKRSNNGETGTRGTALDGASPGRGARRGRPGVTDPIKRKPRRPLPEFTGMTAPRADADAEFVEFLPVALQIVSKPPPRALRALAYALCCFVTGAVLWSIFGQLRLFAIAPGELQTRGGSQIIEPLEAGRVSAVPVQNGSHVDKGSVVLQLDPTAALAAKTIVEAKLANARAEAVRRTAAAAQARQPVINKDAPLSWSSDIPADVRAREESVLHADLGQLAAAIADLQAKQKAEQALGDKFAANINAQKTLIDSRTKRSAMHETLAKQGWDSRALVLQSLEPLRQDQVNLANYEGALDEAKANVAAFESSIAELRASFIADNIDAATKSEREVADLLQQLKQAEVDLTNLALRAPVSGAVQALAITSVGQSVKAGEKLMQIVPDDAPLEIQAYVLNTDIGFVRVGQPATIKIDTFPYTRYGTIEGKVTRVGADAVTGKYAASQQKDDATTPSKGQLSATNAAQPMKDLVFPVTVTRCQIHHQGRRPRRSAHSRHVGRRRDRDAAPARHQLHLVPADPGLLRHYAARIRWTAPPASTRTGAGLVREASLPSPASARSRPGGASRPRSRPASLQAGSPGTASFADSAAFRPACWTSSASR